MSLSDILLLIGRVGGVLFAAFLIWGAILSLKSNWPKKDRAGIAHSISQITLSIGILFMGTIDYWVYGLILMLIGLLGMRIRALNLRKSGSHQSNETNVEEDTDADNG